MDYLKRDSELFEEWFINHFLLHIPPQRPVLLLLDEHSSHYQPRLIRKAAENHVILFCLPPHTTHLCQPLDRTCFSPLKSAYNDECQNYIFANPGKVIKRFNFTLIFSTAWTSAMTPSNIVAGFRVTHIFPLNRYAVIRHLQPVEDREIVDLASQMELHLPLYSPTKSRIVDTSCTDGDYIQETNDTSASSNVSLDVSVDESFAPKGYNTSETSVISDVLPNLPLQMNKRKLTQSAQILTSVENLKLIEAKEQEKMKLIEAKELRKRERERERERERSS